jgi:glutamine synthetase adenylyltransferase
MTNRLLGMVIAFALTSGVVAHAAQAPQRPLAPAGLPSASSLPAALQTAASHISEVATGVIDPSAAIRDAYQRDHVALEQLRQQASQLKGTAHPAFNQFISDQEAALLEIERTALATSRPDASSTIAAMDTLVADAQTELNRELSQPGSTKPNGSSQGGSSQDNSHSGKSNGGNH